MYYFCTVFDFSVNSKRRNHGSHGFHGCVLRLDLAGTGEIYLDRAGFTPGAKAARGWSLARVCEGLRGFAKN